MDAGLNSLTEPNASGSISKILWMPGVIAVVVFAVVGLGARAGGVELFHCRTGRTRGGGRYAYPISPVLLGSPTLRQAAC